jgi:hypothetical protein
MGESTDDFVRRERPAAALATQPPRRSQDFVMHGHLMNITT